MKKIKKTIKALREIIKNPWLLNLVLAQDELWAKKVEQKHGLSGGLPVVELSDLFPDFEETLSTFAFLGGGSLPTDIALLKNLSRKFPETHYFEIGTWRGESVINVAEVAQKCYTLNLSKEQILGLGLQEKYADLHGFFSKKQANITHLFGDSMHYDFAALHQKFDLIFIDGDHHYEYVKNDTQKVFSHLLHEHSIVVWHDYARSPEEVRPEVLAGILDGIPPQFQGNLYHVANTLCAVFIRENYPTKKLEQPTEPNKKFEVNIKIRPIA